MFKKAIFSFFPSGKKKYGSGDVEYCTPSPQGTYYILHMKDYSIEIYDKKNITKGIKNKHPGKPIKNNDFCLAIFDPTGQFLAVHHQSVRLIDIYKTKTMGNTQNKPIFSIETSDLIRDVALANTKNGFMLAASNWHNKIFLYNYTKSSGIKLVETINTPQVQLCKLALVLAENGRNVILAAGDYYKGMTSVYQIDTTNYSNKHLISVKEHKDSTKHLELISSKEEVILASYAHDKILHLHRINISEKNAGLIGTITCANQNDSSYGLDEFDKFALTETQTNQLVLAIATTEGVEIFRANNGHIKHINTFPLKEQIHGLIFQEDGRLLVSGKQMIKEFTILSTYKPLLEDEQERVEFTRKNLEKSYEIKLKNTTIDTQKPWLAL